MLQYLTKLKNVKPKDVKKAVKTGVKTVKTGVDKGKSLYKTYKDKKKAAKSAAKAKETRDLKRDAKLTEYKVTIAEGNKKLKELSKNISPERFKKITDTLKKSGSSIGNILSGTADRGAKLLGLRPYEKAFLFGGRGTQLGRLTASAGIGTSVFQDFPQFRRDFNTMSKKDLIDKYGTQAIRNVDAGIDAIVGKQGGGNVKEGLKKIPAGKAGAGLRALKRENPSLVREQFKYAKKGGKILAKKKKKKKVKYVGVGKALRGYGSVRRG